MNSIIFQSWTVFQKNPGSDVTGNLSLLTHDELKHIQQKKKDILGVDALDSNL